MKRRTFLTSTTALTGLVATAPLAAASPIHSGRIKFLVSDTFDSDQLDQLAAAVPSVDLVVCKGAGEAMDHIEEAHATYGLANADLIRAGQNLRWIQWPSAGVENIVAIPELVERDIVLTNMQRIYAPEIADQTMGYLLAFTRKLGHSIVGRTWDKLPDEELDELPGKTMLIVGLGGIGDAIARRAAAFGMTVLATDPKVYETPLSVAELHKPDALPELLPRANVVVSAVPLTPVSQKMFDADAFARMKQGAIFINVSRGRVADTEALIAALDCGQLAAAGLDVTDPEPLPAGHPLWERNVIITPHSAGQSPGGRNRAFALFQENLVRFASGLMLLNIVDKQVGY